MFSQASDGTASAQQVRPGDGAARLLSAAVDLFGRQGVRATSLKQIAAQAGTSPTLVVHHYGTKDGLREACDKHVAALLRSKKLEAVAKGPRLNPLAGLGWGGEHAPVLRYLARTLTDGSPHVNALVDEMVADAEQYTAEGERAGLVRPSADPRARVVLLMLWSLGGLVLHEHLERLLDVDMVNADRVPERYVRAVLEIYCDGVLTPDAYQEFRQQRHDDPNDPAPTG